jgi:membrane-bound serine protease (ClpP class)
MLLHSYLGLWLIALAMAFIVAEVFAPTSGMLAAGGIVAFVLGTLFLVDTDIRIYGISWPLVLTIAGISLLFALLAVAMAVKARRRPVVTGQEQMVGAPGEVLADFSGEGWATVHGETWRVRSTAPLTQGQRIRVTHVDGLTLDVELQSTQPTRSTS